MRKKYYGKNTKLEVEFKKKHTKPVTIRATMLGESKGNTELCLDKPL